MLKRTQDRKTANLSTPNGKQSKIANAFSLPAGKAYSCPSATAFCENICYAGKLERIYKGFRDVVLHNFSLVQNASYHEIVILLSQMIDAFRADCVKHNAPMLFRIHADGDFFKWDYTAAWSEVISNNPDIQFWAYTRVVEAAEYLQDSELPNLSLYFSGDPDNIADAYRLEARGIRVAFVAKTFDDAKAAFKGARCPEQNNKSFDIINNDGGACVRCGLCPMARGNVLFSASKK